MNASLHRPLAALLLLATAALSHAAAPAVDEATALLNEGKFELALKRIEVHLASAPQDAEARFTRGLILVKMNRADEAIRNFAELTRDYPQLPEPYNNLAVLYAQQGEYEKARDALEAALATHPSYATAHENLGDIYAALAGAAYNRALLLDQANEGARYKLSLIGQLDTTDRPAAAVAAAVDLAPAEAVTQTEVDAVSAAVSAWAAGWSAKNLDGYFGAYAAEFKPENGVGRNAWQAQRRERIRKPASIKVTVADLQVSRLDAQRVQAVFRQNYQSDLISNEVTKVLEFASTGGAWKIVREYVR